MQARYEEMTLDTRGDGDVVDVTPDAQKAIDNSGLADGLCTVFVAHSRAALIGPSVSVPFAHGELLTGVWQKIVCIDFDDRPRTRKVMVQLLGV
jgi:thiamine phosphate synthase YjbQ (UPF0047 family)